MADEVQVNGSVDRTIEISVEPSGVGISGSQSYPSVTVDFSPMVYGSGFAHKVAEATNGNLAGLDANGDITDSGVPATVWRQAGKVAGVGELFQYYGPTAENVGKIVTFTEPFVILSDDYFVVDGISLFPANTSVVLVNVGTEQNPSYKYDIIANGINIKKYIGKPTNVTYRNFPMFANSDGDLTDSGKSASDFIAMPTGGTAGQVLKKTNEGTEWANESGGGGAATDVQINGTSITSSNVANIVTESAYNASTNKIATMSDVPDTTNCITKSQTAGLVKNDGTIDTTSYGTYSKPSGGIPAADIASGVIPTVPTISTDIAADKSSATKTASPSAVYNEVHPAVGSSQPAGGMLPNVLYKLGTLSGSVTISLASATDNTIENEYRMTFTADSTAPTITWPNTVTKWIGNSLDNGAPKVEASTYYEVSIQDGYGIFNAY